MGFVARSEVHLVIRIVITKRGGGSFSPRFRRGLLLLGPQASPMSSSSSRAADPGRDGPGRRGDERYGARRAAAAAAHYFLLFCPSWSELQGTVQQWSLQCPISVPVPYLRPQIAPARVEVLCNFSM